MKQEEIPIKKEHFSEIKTMMVKKIVKGLEYIERKSLPLKTITIATNNRRWTSGGKQ